MIQCALEQLPKDRNDHLRAWLGQSEAATFKAVVDAQLKSWQVKALSDALESNPHNLKLEGANAALQKAQRYAHCLEVFEEIIAKREPHEIARLS